MSSLLSLVRILIAVAGGYLVKDGILTASDLTETAGAVATLLPILWAVWKNYHKNQQLAKVEAGASVQEAKNSTPLLAK